MSGYCDHSVHHTEVCVECAMSEREERINCIHAALKEAKRGLRATKESVGTSTQAWLLATTTLRRIEEIERGKL